METDRIKWNRRFDSQPFFLGINASPFLQREIERVKRLAPGNRALDVACGEGRNSIFLARHGFATTGLDISDIGIAKAQQLARDSGLSVDFRRVDLDGYRIAEQYDLILNFNFLLRSLIPQEVGALAPGGVLMFDTILESPQLLETHNPDYFLRYGELERIFGAYRGEILFSEESSEGEMPTARLLFRKHADS
jgi:2-polyprenyl-3-methyl-5-hydroxy-6-metoxy-1,4-benzoquinol methylase